MPDSLFNVAETPAVNWGCSALSWITATSSESTWLSGAAGVKGDCMV